MSDISRGNSTGFGPVLTHYGETEKKFNCECLKCGHTLKTTKHCIDLKCPKCGGQMRRKERPGPGQEKFSLGDSPIESTKKPPGTYVCIECGDAQITFRTAVDEYKVRCPKCGTTMVRRPNPLT